MTLIEELEAALNGDMPMRLERVYTTDGRPGRIISEDDLRKLISARPSTDMLADALRPFAEFAEEYGAPWQDDVELWQAAQHQVTLTIGDLRRARQALAAYSAGEVVGPFQPRVAPWMQECFGPEVSADRLERSDRFIEEALELVQASDYPKERAHELVEYVYGRPQGEINQEVGGVMVTLAAHCLAHGVDMHEAGETELARILQPDVIERIRRKQASKPHGSALPVPSTNTHQLSGVEVQLLYRLNVNQHTQSHTVVEHDHVMWSVGRSLSDRGLLAMVSHPKGAVFHITRLGVETLRTALADGVAESGTMNNFATPRGVHP